MKKNEISEALEPVIKTLDEVSIPYCISGSILPQNSEADKLLAIFFYCRLAGVLSCDSFPKVHTFRMGCLP